MDAIIPSQITGILESISSGDRDAFHRLIPLVYNQLRKIARSKIAAERGKTLQTTDLVHEVYLRLLRDEQPQWENRRHFYSVAAEAMRRILVENARKRSSIKRGGGGFRIQLNEDAAGEYSDPDRMLSFDRALTRLEGNDPVMSQVVQLRCFAGLTVKETAQALNLSPRSVDRFWSAARAWLHREMSRSEAGTP